MTLLCGGRGPCCHVSYPHRHCEHCDVVVPIQHCHHGFPYGTYYGLSNLGGTLSGWGQSQFSQLANQQSNLQALQSSIVDVSHTHEEN